MYISILSAEPANYRLPVAMSISTAIVSAIMALDVGWKIEWTDSSPMHQLPLMIHIRKSEPTVESARVDDIAPIRIQRHLRTNLYDKSLYNTPTVIPVAPEPARDWNAISQDFAEQHVTSLKQGNEALAAMWRRSPSVMFESQNEFGVINEVQLVADLDFKEPVGVLGVGLIIGSCFVGIPLIGIPVEERSVAVRLWYCQ